MAKKSKSKQEPKCYNVDLMQPDEVNSLKRLVVEFVQKAQTIENEIATLNEDQKVLVEQYSDRLDMKTLKMAMQVVKLKARVQHKDTFDLFSEALLDPTISTNEG